MGFARAGSNNVPFSYNPGQRRLTLNCGKFLLDEGNGYPNEPVVRLRRDEVRIGCTVVSGEAAKEIMRQWEASSPEFGFSEVKVQG